MYAVCEIMNTIDQLNKALAKHKGWTDVGRTDPHDKNLSGYPPGASQRTPLLDMVNDEDHSKLMLKEVLVHFGCNTKIGIAATYLRINGVS